ncbi:MAG: FGGY family carbohydrate kinase [Gaiellales bacterium]
MSGDLVIGVDVGSQGTCAQLIDQSGKLLAASYVAHELSYPRPGWAEQDARQWVTALAQALHEVVQKIRPERVDAIAFASQLDGLVAVDGACEPVRPAMIWMDRRADVECEEVAKRIDPERLRQISGCNLDASHVAAKIAWLCKHEADAHRDCRSYLLPGAYVAYKASGVLAIDPSNASSTMLLDVRSRTWSSEACAAFDVDPDRLPPILAPHSVLGPVAPWLREASGLSASTMIVLGCGDEMAGTLGAGVVEPGDVCDVMGTAEPVCAVTDVPLHDPSGVVELHPHADPESWLLENPGWLSGGAYRWFRDHLGEGEIAEAERAGSDVYELLNAVAAEAPPGADGLVWLPALAGAMTPEWNARARATWFGLTPAHGRSHMLRALLEGNALALRDVLGAIRDTGRDVNELVCVAGGAKGRLGLQIRADVTGVPVSRPDDVETTARGAAMLAAVGAGMYGTVREAGHAMAPPRVDRIEPDPANSAVYDELHGRYRELYAALRPLFDTLPA